LLSQFLFHQYYSASLKAEELQRPGRALDKIHP